MNVRGEMKRMYIGKRVKEMLVNEVEVGDCDMSG